MKRWRREEKRRRSSPPLYVWTRVKGGGKMQRRHRVVASPHMREKNGGEMQRRAKEKGGLTIQICAVI